MKQATGAQALVRKPIQLVVTHRGQVIAEKTFQTTPIRIGRMLDNDIVLPFDFASRYHCELRFDGEGWMATDLGSKNGLLLKDGRNVRETKLDDGSEFKIKEVTIAFSECADDDFSDTFVPAMAEEAAEEATPFNAPVPMAAVPVVRVSLENLLLRPHPGLKGARHIGLQMAVVWQDQILDTREFAIGATVIWNWQGELRELGRVGKSRTGIRPPRGCSPASLTIVPDTPAAFQLRENIFVFFRYVPKSKALPLSTTWTDEKMINPMILSGSIHGAATLALVFTTSQTNYRVIPEDEPERFAKIIVEPPIPLPTPPVIAQATPTPPPAPPATPTPEKQVAKHEATPKPKLIKIKPVKVVVSEKKFRKMAVAKKQDAERHQAKLPEKLKPMPVPMPPKPVAIAKNELPAPPAEPSAAPAPTPKPFDAKSVGALKMLSLLSVNPATTKLTNVDKIQISRAPASVQGDLVGNKPMKGTGDMISDLNKSASGGNTGPGNGSIGIAVGGKSTGNYTFGGLTSKTGKRKVLGSVVGGATYTELTKNEGLTRDQVMKEVEKHQSQIQRCYERSLIEDPDLVGRADFEWEISAKGAVSDVEVKSTTLKSGEGLLSCVKGVFASMKFPTAKNGETTTPTIGLPFGRL